MVKCILASRAFAILIALSAATRLDASMAAAHPLHTSLVELSYDHRTGSVIASVKVFEDDFTRHVNGPAGGESQRGEQRAFNYFLRTLVVATPRGDVVSWRWCGSKRSGDLIVICLSGKMVGGLSGARVKNAILSDLFPDQINILQVTLGSARHSILFTAAETTRRLP